MIQFTSISKDVNGNWTFTWASTGAPSYRVVLNGTQLAVTASTSYTTAIPGYPKFPPPIEVVPSGQLADTEVYRQPAKLQWYSSPGAVSFVVQQLVGSTWVNAATVSAVGWLNAYDLPILGDDGVYSYRVMAVSAVGDLSAPLNFTVEVAKTPRPPDGTLGFAYTSDSVVVSAA